MPSIYKLRPSKANSWMNCPASALMQAPFIDEDVVSGAAAIGTAAHWVISDGEDVKAGDIAPNGIVIDQDMIDHGEDYLDTLSGYSQSVGDMVLEETIDMPFLENEGTPDLYDIDYDRKILLVADYKYGFNPVEVYENWQLLIYAKAIIEKYNLQNYSVDFAIYQPRAYHVQGIFRTAFYTYEELLPYFDQIEQGAKLALSENPPLKTGKHCKYCEARHICGALEKATFMGIQISQEISTNELNINQASEELEKIDEAVEILKARKTGLEAQIVHQLQNGEKSALWELDRVKSRERWKEGEDEKIIEMGKMLGKNLAAPMKALTPAQCRKLKVEEMIIQEYSYRPVGEIKLVKLNLNEAKKLFGK